VKKTEEAPVARDKPPQPKLVLEFDGPDERWHHEIQVGRWATAVVANGEVKGRIISKQEGLVGIELSNAGGGRVLVKLDDIYKVRVNP
jgi:hypothetical protein